MLKIEVKPVSRMIFSTSGGRQQSPNRSPGSRSRFAAASSTRRPPLLIYETPEKSRRIFLVPSPITRVIACSSSGAETVSILPARARTVASPRAQS